MKLLLSFFILTTSFSSYAFDTNFWILSRVPGKVKTRLYKKKLTDFIMKNQFEGKYFKIVLGQSNTAIKFDDSDENLVKKAATVYYHLTKARNYWVQTVGSQYAKEKNQTTIRINIDSKYSKVGHYANANKEKEYNNALTIPAGETPALLDVHD